MESALRFLADFGATEARFSRGLRRLWAKTRAPGPHRGCKRLLGGRSGPENGGSARGCAIDRGGCAIDRFWGESENRLAVAQAVTLVDELDQTHGRDERVYL